MTSSYEVGRLLLDRFHHHVSPGRCSLLDFGVFIDNRRYPSALYPGSGDYLLY
jgi:hypothetical protein